MNAFFTPEPKPEDRKESSALWESLDMSSDSAPAALVALVAQKNSALTQSRKRAAEAPAVGTPVSTKKARTP